MKNTLVLKTHFKLSVTIIGLCQNVCQGGFIMFTIKPLSIPLWSFEDRMHESYSNLQAFETNIQNR